MRKKVYEWPTSELRWTLDGALQQRWMIQWRDDETRGAANPETSEWREIPQESALAAQRTPNEILEATAAQHFDLPKGKPAKFIRNGILKTCQCLDCAALAPADGGKP